MSAKDIKLISQFITGEEDPLQIDVNTLFVLLTVSSRLKIKDKLSAILRFISFDPEETTLDEAKYIF